MLLQKHMTSSNGFCRLSQNFRKTKDLLWVGGLKITSLIYHESGYDIKWLFPFLEF